MEVRRTRAADWRQLRELRLRALADAPDAFASTLELEAGLAEEVWRQRARGGPDAAGFIAHRDGAGAGMAAVVTEPAVPGRVHLVGMWVDPRHRRQGLARALIDQVLGWARGHAAREVVLWVADHNSAARTLYQRAGFEPTGERQPLPSNHALTESLLSMRLEG